MIIVNGDARMQDVHAVYQSVTVLDGGALVNNRIDDGVSAQSVAVATALVANSISGTVSLSGQCLCVANAMGALTTVASESPIVVGNTVNQVQLSAPRTLYVGNTCTATVVVDGTNVVVMDNLVLSGGVGVPHVDVAASAVDCVVVHNVFISPGAGLSDAGSGTVTTLTGNALL